VLRCKCDQGRLLSDDGNHPTERIQHSKHSNSFKSRTVSLSKKWHQIYVLSKETLCDIGKGLQASP
jgi:hypothetical protein